MVRWDTGQQTTSSLRVKQQWIEGRCYHRIEIANGPTQAHILRLQRTEQPRAGRL